MNISCIYCKNEGFEIGAGSREHVILSALGGKKSSRNTCCVTCNRRLGNEIDEPLSYGVRYLSNLCGIRTGRNKGAASIASAGCYDNRTFDLISGGKIRHSKAHVADPIVDEDSGTVSISISGRDKDEINVLLAHQLRRFGKNIKDIEIVKAVETVQYPGLITMDVDVGLKVHYRSIAKSALTYLATLTSPARIRSREFKAIIEYINGVSELDKFVCLTRCDFPETKTISNIQHRVLICASSFHNKVVGLVELFGGIKFKVLLSESWEGSDLYKGYIVDGVNGVQENEVFSLSINENSLFDEISPLPDDEFREMCSDVMSQVYKLHVETEKRRIMREIFEGFCKEHGGKDFSDELAMELSTKLAIQLANNLFRVDEVLELDKNEIKKPPLHDGPSA